MPGLVIHIMASPCHIPTPEMHLSVIDSEQSTDRMMATMVVMMMMMMTAMTTMTMMVMTTAALRHYASMSVCVFHRAGLDM